MIRPAELARGCSLQAALVPFFTVGARPNLPAARKVAVDATMICTGDNEAAVFSGMLHELCSHQAQDRHRLARNAAADAFPCHCIPCQTHAEPLQGCVINHVPWCHTAYAV